MRYRRSTKILSSVLAAVMILQPIMIAIPPEAVQAAVPSVQPSSPSHKPTTNIPTVTVPVGSHATPSYTSLTRPDLESGTWYQCGILEVYRLNYAGYGPEDLRSITDFQVEAGQAYWVVVSGVIVDDPPGSYLVTDDPSYVWSDNPDQHSHFRAALIFTSPQLTELNPDYNPDHVYNYLVTASSADTGLGATFGVASDGDSTYQSGAWTFAFYKACQAPAGANNPMPLDNKNGADCCSTVDIDGPRKSTDNPIDTQT